MQNIEKQVEELDKLIESEIFNEAQKGVFKRLRFFTEHGTEHHMASYMNSMEKSSVLWISNYLDLMG